MGNLSYSSQEQVVLDTSLISDNPGVSDDQLTLTFAVNTPFASGDTVSISGLRLDGLNQTQEPTTIRMIVDGEGNYTFGVKEHIIFPEIKYDKVDKIRGMDITIVTSSSKDEYAKSLLKGFNFPLRNDL